MTVLAFRIVFQLFMALEVCNLSHPSAVKQVTRGTWVFGSTGAL